MNNIQDVEQIKDIFYKIKNLLIQKGINETNAAKLTEKTLDLIINEFILIVIEQSDDADLKNSVKAMDFSTEDSKQLMLQLFHNLTKDSKSNQLQSNLEGIVEKHILGLLNAIK